MTNTCWRSNLWWRWIAANSAAEFIGLGTAAAVGFLVATRLGEPHGLPQTLLFAALFVLLGAFEGLIVGFAQAKVLVRRLPDLQGWVQATVVGAVVAWVIGMAPSTIMSLTHSGGSGPPPEIGEPLRLLLAAGLGLVAGPVLAFFQWRCLRRCVSRRAAWWLPANAAAWALGMPIIFVSAHLGAGTSNPILVMLGVGASLLAAGAVVGAVHGCALVWLVSADGPFDKAG